MVEAEFLHRLAVDDDLRLQLLYQVPGRGLAETAVTLGQGGVADGAGLVGRQAMLGLKPGL